MPGFDPLGFRATDWRAVGFGILGMLIGLPLVAGAIIFSGTVLTNPASYPPLVRGAAWVVLVLLVSAGVAGYLWKILRAPREAQEAADEIKRIQGEFTKLEPVSQQGKVRKAMEGKREGK